MMQEVDHQVYFEMKTSRLQLSIPEQEDIDEGILYEEINEYYKIEEEHVYCIVNDSNNDFSSNVKLYTGDKLCGSPKYKSYENLDPSQIVKSCPPVSPVNKTAVDERTESREDEANCLLKAYMNQHLPGHENQNLESINTNPLMENLAKNIMAKNVKENPYKCSKCDFNSSQACKLSSHVQTEHPKDRHYKCPACGYRGRYPSSLRNHYMAIHKKRGPHQCKKCDYRSADNNALRNHIANTHRKQKLHACPKCEYKASSPCWIRSHMKAVHENVAARPSLNRRLRALYSGDLEEYKAGNKKKKRNHRCSDCLYSAPQKSDLRKHIMAVHEKQRPHHCLECPYRALTFGTLKRHMNIVHFKHDGCEDPNSCWICSIGGKTGGNVVRTPEVYECPHCDFVGPCQLGLTEHIMVQHTLQFTENVLNANTKKV